MNLIYTCDECAAGNCDQILTIYGMDYMLHTPMAAARGKEVIL